MRYENLNVGAEVYVGSRALPSFVNFITNIVEGFLGFLHVLPTRKKHLTILQDVSGIIKPNRYGKITNSYSFDFLSLQHSSI